MTFLLLCFLAVACATKIDDSKLAVAAASFNQTAMKNTLTLAYAAYCGLNVNANFDCFWCSKYTGSFRLVGLFGKANSSSFGYVGVDANSQQTFVVVRGTDNCKPISLAATPAPAHNFCHACLYARTQGSAGSLMQSLTRSN